MRVKTNVNGWSIVQTGIGIAIKQLGDSTLEVCLSVDSDGELVINVYQEGVDQPVFIAKIEEN
jgi:hypothetical protein